MYKRQLENLANGIILQAKEDYVWSRRVLNNQNQYIPKIVKKAEELAEDTEEFFSSAWYSTLTTVPAEIVLEQCRKEISYEFDCKDLPE